MNANMDILEFRLIHVNIRGVQSNKQNLEHYLIENGLPEIVTLNETMLRGDKNITIDGYYCAARREPIGMSGKHGSMILVKETICEVVELDFFKTQFQEEVIGIEILGKDKQTSLNIVSYYNPPRNKVNPGIFCKSLYRHSNTIFVGDLNCKNISWGSTYTDSQGLHLADTIDDQNWILLNDGSKTRIDPRSGKEEVLDIILCQSGILNLSPKVHVGDRIGSDHLPLHCSLNYDKRHSKDPIFFKNVSQIDRTRFKKLVNDGVNTLPGTFSTASDLDIIADAFPLLFKAAFEASCPLTKKHEKRKPVSLHILALIKEKRALRR